MQNQTAVTPQRLPRTAWLGLVVLVVAEVLLAQRVTLVAVYFTPIAWTAYIFAADGFVYWRSGRSLIVDNGWFTLVIAVWSILCWVVFEGYNLHLQNWRYIGLPDDLTLRAVGYAWAFATIFPGIFETYDLLSVLGVMRTARSAPFAIFGRQKGILMAAGVVCLIVPLLLPSATATYLFALVWLGFVFLLEPITDRLGGETILGDLVKGQPARLYRLLLAGAICGLLWEFWNYWAIGKWIYSVPAPLDFGPKIFEMPLLGFLGFPPFAVECFAFQSLLLALLRRPWVRSTD